MRASALDSPGAAPRTRGADPLRHRHGRDRAHRAAARRNARAASSAQALHRAGAGRQRRRRGPRREPRRALRREGGVRRSSFRASSRWAPSSPPTSRSRATATARRRSSAAPNARDVLARHRLAGIAVVADARPHAARRRSRSRCRRRRRAPLAGKLLYRLLPIRRRVVLENLRRVFGERVPATPKSSASRRRTTRTSGGSSREFVRFRFLSRAAQARAGARREPRRLHAMRSRAARAC